MIPPGANRYINRELSWLEFNQRVLEEAQDARNPLLERLKFFCIVSSNLDEFFEVRVAGLKQQIESEVVRRSPDGLTATECFRAVAARVRRMVAAQYAGWREQLVPALAREGIRFVAMSGLAAAERDWLEGFYRAEVRPVLTPLAIDPAHPFPQLLNKSLNLIVQLEVEAEGERRRRLAVVQVPRNLPRLVRLPSPTGRQDCVFLGQLIGHYLADLFAGIRIAGFWVFRLTRNSELYIDEEEVANLLKAVETELHNRRRGEAVRLEVQQGCPGEIVAELLQTLHLTTEDLYEIDGPLNPTRLMMIYEGDHSPELRDPPYLAPVVAAAQGPADLWTVLRRGDVLLHHPYDSFETVVDFLRLAAADPRVLAIKQTLYRTGGDVRVVGALMEAVRNGKQVTAVVELKARFDEANNIEWARRLEEAGVHVVYGLVGFKIHCKVTLVVRRDDDGLRRYLHLGTGNYNPTTARIYTDLGLLTCQTDFGEDATNLFNLLTGICQFQGTRQFWVAPYQIHGRMIELIRREASHARRGLPARIVAKMNSLVDTQIIEELYAASQAGVKVELIVRGVCCLRPGVKGLSENVSVRSIVGRFLEHSRVFYFENACRPEVFVGSADWMPRNFFKRIEVVFPLVDGQVRERVVSEVLGLALADNLKARLLQADGGYVRAGVEPGQSPRESQSEFMARALAAAKSVARQAQYEPQQVKVKLAPRPKELGRGRSGKG
ncbi:MAG: polyphosphate kinase 1 [Verrucomicrobia bacterium]|nr:polyphosphate kinase 1 [Verrucomicrobiota bacterium]